MKHIIFSLLLITFSNAQSQTPTLRIHQNDGSLLKVPLSNIDSLTHVVENAGVFASITTAPATGVTSSSVTTGGNISNNGGSAVTQRGICWDTLPNPTIARNKLESGTGNGSFSVSLSNLLANKTYYIRAFATNTVGTLYGNQVTFTTFGVTPPSSNEIWMIGTATSAGWTNPLTEPLRTSLKFNRVSPTQYELITDLIPDKSFIAIPQLGSWNYFSLGRSLGGLDFVDSGFFAIKPTATGIYFTSRQRPGKYKFSLDFQSGKYKLVHTQSASFSQFSFSDNQLTRSYSIVPGSTFYLPVSFIEPFDKARSIKFVYSSNQIVRGVNYNAPDSIVIPAGKLLDSIPLRGVYETFSGITSDTVKIKIADGLGVFRRDSVRLIMRKYCDVVLSQLIGQYPNTNDYSSTNTFQHGPYITVVDNLVATGPTSAEGYFVNLYDDGWNDIKFLIDWSNSSNFSISIPEQSTGSSSSTVRFVRSTPGRINTFSSCEQSFTISIDRLDANKQLLGSAGYQIRLRR